MRPRFKESGRFFEKKLRKKLLKSPAFERPQYGRAKAGDNKSFLVTFFQKSNRFLPTNALCGAIFQKETDR
jgi:hypothetical protein